MHPAIQFVVRVKLQIVITNSTCETHLLEEDFKQISDGKRGVSLFYITTPPVLTTCWSGKMLPYCNSRKIVEHESGSSHFCKVV